MYKRVQNWFAARIKIIAKSGRRFTNIFTSKPIKRVLPTKKNDDDKVHKGSKRRKK